MEATTIKTGIFATLAAAGSIVANWLGGWDAALKVLLFMMAMDYLTGLALSGIFHKSPKTENGMLASGECFKGLVRKLLILVYVMVAVMLDNVLGTATQALGAAYVRTAVILFFIANEGLSIIENTALMGVPYPAFLKKMLEALKEKNDGGGESGD